MAQWLSWLERRPVTAEVESSSLFWVVSPIIRWGRIIYISRSGGIGRRPGLKIPWVVIPVPVRPRPAALQRALDLRKGSGAFLIYFIIIEGQGDQKKWMTKNVTNLLRNYIDK